MKPIDRKPTLHAILQQLEVTEGTPHPDTPGTVGPPEPKPFNMPEWAEVRNARPPTVPKEAWRVPGIAEKPLVRKEEEPEEPITIGAKAPVRQPRTDHREDERDPVYAEVRAIKKAKKLEDRKKHSAILKEKKAEKLLKGFAAQFERRSRDEDFGI